MRLAPVLAAIGSAAVVTFAATAEAQPAAARHFLEVGAQWSYLPLYGGDATVSGFHTTGLTLRLGAHLRRVPVPYAETFYTRTARDDFHGAPGLQLFGLALGVWSSPPESGRIAVLAAVGAGRLLADVKEKPPCLPPLCFAEGGTDYRDAALWTFLGDVGVLIPLARRLGVRADARLHIPVGDTEGARDSANERFELAVGISIRP